MGKGKAFLTAIIMSKLALILSQFLVFTLVSASVDYCLPDQNQSFCPADGDEPWTYRGPNGPRYWGQTYPQCNGRRQSPVAIQNAEICTNLPKLAFNNYDTPIRSATVENNGYYVNVRPTDGVVRTISVRGDIYALDQFHFHLGCFGFGGSEHTINGQRNDMEMHLVHVNGFGRYAVVAVLARERDDSINTALQPIVNRLRQIMYKGDQTQLDLPLNLNNLLPANPATFYRYEGSMSMPPCTEDVTWSVLSQTIIVEKYQLDEFRSLYSTTVEKAEKFCRIAPNIRPLQPLNGRQVCRSQ